MDTTHTWHPGTYRIRSKWPISVDLLPDELISSWLIRTSRLNFCDPLTLTNKIWPKWRAWTVDLDRWIPPLKLQSLLTVSGIPKKILKSAFLNQIILKTSKRPPPTKAIWPFILCLGSRNLRRRGGLQYCPACLKESPYYRIQWRLAWHTTCYKHSCFLLDRCQECNSPLEPHRLNEKFKNIARCAVCGSNLSLHILKKFSDQTSDFQKVFDNVVYQGIAIYNNQQIKACEWFEIWRFFSSFLRRVNRSKTETLLMFCRSLNIEIPNFLQSGASIETLLVHQRHSLLKNTQILMCLGTQTLIDECKKASMTRQAFCGKNEFLPQYLYPIYQQLKDNPRKPRKRRYRRRFDPRSKAQVQKMMEKLKQYLEMSFS